MVTFRIVTTRGVCGSHRIIMALSSCSQKVRYSRAGAQASADSVRYVLVNKPHLPKTQFFTCHIYAEEPPHQKGDMVLH
jgi:hypothetical protein